ncbi:MAG: phosphogluconate dehydrogenase (NAD(+)-dependent, decarboxylating) [Anaerolineae bacterium]|jgi:6-phosphogluconate dehydrogenase
MELGVVGLGRMGRNIARRLARAGHHVVVYNRTTERALELADSEPNVEAARTLSELAERLEPPRIAWVMVPAGEPTELMIEDLLSVFSPGDMIVDGGNSNYQDTIRRAARVEQAGLEFVDVGTSGGIWGLENGFSLMVGGSVGAVDKLQPVFQSLAPAPDRGWGHVGPSGAGHFVKMVHNGIEYGMMQAYAEGFEVLHAKKEFQLDLHQIAGIWCHGSVVRSWLLSLIEAGLAEDQELSDIRGWVADSGEGRWTVKEAMDLDVPAPVITLALLMRFVSRQEDSYAAKLLAMMRNQFGGHAVMPSE